MIWFTDQYAQTRSLSSEEIQVFKDFFDSYVSTARFKREKRTTRF